MNMDKLKERMGDEEFDAGRALYRRGAVRENQRSADFLTYSVAGAHGFIRIYPNGRMECPCEKSPFRFSSSNNMGMLADEVFP